MKNLKVALLQLMPEDIDELKASAVSANSDFGDECD